MSHHFHLLLTLTALVLFCWIPLSSAQSQGQIAITRFPFHESFQMLSSDMRFYRLYLYLFTTPKDLDLTISVVPEQGSDSPKIFTSYTEEFPQMMNDTDNSSMTILGNTIFISSHDLNGSPLYLFLGLACESPVCNANIIAKWTRDTKVIAIGEKIVESLNGVSSALMNLTIPKEDEIERIVIHVDAIKTSKKDELPFLEVSINQGKSISLTNDTTNIARRSSWFGGVTIVIDRDSSFFCTDCTYTLSLKYTESSSINVQAQSYKNYTLISGETILDGVQKGKENSYRFLGRENFHKEDFVVSVKVNTGRVKVSIGWKTSYHFSASYYWHHQIENSQDIILSHKWRLDHPYENYYILIEGQESSVYSLSATYKNPNQLLMGKAIPVRNEIFPQEKITYEILMPLFIAAEGITLDINYKQSLEVGIMDCRFATDCPGILPADSLYEISNYSGFADHLPAEKVDYRSEEVAPGELRIEISPHKSGCYPILIQDQAFTKEPILVCAYKVILSNQKLSPVGYAVTVGYKGPNLLTIGEPQFDVVAKDNSLYYVLSVSPHIENIESIQIQLTKFFGDADIFISKTEKYPNKLSDNCDIRISYEGFLVIKGSSGTYYIGVHGLGKSSFSISAVVQTKPKVTGDSAFLLRPGKPQKGVLFPRHQYQAQFYKILLNEDPYWDGILRITVKSLSGRVLIFANNNGELPTEENHQWKGEDHNLRIHLEQYDLKKDGLYNVGIFIDMMDPDAHPLTELTYYITYTLITSPNFERVDFEDGDDGYLPMEYPIHMFLSQNTPFYDVIQREEIRYFEALVPVDQFPVTIHKQSAGGNIEIFISMDPKNKNPGRYFFNEKTTKDYITLKACEGNIALICSVYIAATLTGGWEETSFSLAISYSQESSAISLPADQQIQSIIPMNDYPANFYYHAIPSKFFVVSVSCPGSETVIYAKRVKVTIESQEKPEVKILKENIAEFSGSNEISVPPLADSDFTIVVVSVYFKKTWDSQSTFKIVASSQISQLSLGTPFTGSVEKDRYVYFMTNVPKHKCALLICLKSRETDLVVSYGENARPLISNPQFSLISKEQVKIIEIDHVDISPRNSMSGNWVIGVYGHETSYFTLSMIYQDQKTVNVDLGIPIEMMSLKESSFVYFKYSHAVRQNLQLNLTKFSGQFNLYMTSMKPDEDFVGSLPNQTHYKWQILQAASQSVTTFDFNDCVVCMYLIKVEAISESKFSLAIDCLSNYTPIQGGIQYKGQLKPQESTVFLLKKSTNFFEENQLDIEMKGNELSIMGSDDSMINLENYIWKETLMSTNSSQIISLHSEDFPRDSFSVLLENPTTDKDVDYSFNMITRRLELQAFFGEKVERLYYLHPLERNYFEWNSIDEYGFSTDVIFYAEGKNMEATMEKDLKHGKRLKARYWPIDQASTEDGQEVYLEAEAEPRSRSNSSHVIFEQTFSIRNPEGKYMVEIANPWRFPVKFRIFLREFALSKYFGFSQFRDDHILKSHHPRFFKFPQKVPGNWYFWLYSCETTIDLKIENGYVETGMVTIPKRNGYLYKETTSAVDRLVWMNVNPKAVSKQGQFIVYSSVFDEKEFRNFDLKEENLRVDVAYKNLKEVAVEFKPMELQDLESYDEIWYQIWLCPDLLRLTVESPICNENIYNWKCQDSCVKLSKSQKDPVKVSFQDVDFGVYFVKIKGTIIYKDRTIKEVEPYVPAYVKVENPISGKSLMHCLESSFNV